MWAVDEVADEHAAKESTFPRAADAGREWLPELSAEAPCSARRARVELR